jgi:hypothetical protein
MRHQDLTLNHRLESWVYANAAARTGATGFVAGDIGRISYQTDTGEYWRLTATTPTWVLVAVGSVPQGGTAGQVLSKTSATNYAASWATLSANAYQTGQYNPTGTASIPGVMMGLGTLMPATITPVRTGAIFFLFTGIVRNSVSPAVTAIEPRWGTGTPPANGAAPVGALIGPGQQAHSPGANWYVPFCTAGLIIGATLGTQIWVDVRLAVNAGTANLLSITAMMFELP